MDQIIITLISNSDLIIRDKFINEQESQPTIIKTSIKINWTKIINGIILESKYFKMIRGLLETEVRIGKLDSRVIQPTIEKEIHTVFKFDEKGDFSPIIRWGKNNTLTPISKIKRIIHYEMFED